MIYGPTLQESATSPESLNTSSAAIYMLFSGKIQTIPDDRLPFFCNVRGACHDFFIPLIFVFISLHGIDRRSKCPYFGFRDRPRGRYASAFVWRCIYLERCKLPVQSSKQLPLMDGIEPLYLSGHQRALGNSTRTQGQTHPFEHGETAPRSDGLDRYNRSKRVSRIEGVHRLETDAFGYGGFSTGAREDLEFDGLSHRATSMCGYIR
jgi:hypothetical protein